MEEITKIRVGDIIVAFYMEQPDTVHINMVNFADINAVISVRHKINIQDLMTITDAMLSQKNFSYDGFYVDSSTNIDGKYKASRLWVEYDNGLDKPCKITLVNGFTTSIDIVGSSMEYRPQYFVTLSLSQEETAKLFSNLYNKLQVDENQR